MKTFKVTYQTVGGHYHDEKRKSITIYAESELDAEFKFVDNIQPLITSPESDMSQIYSIDIKEL